MAPTETPVALDTSRCIADQGATWECGSHSTYNNHDCRGEACRAANVKFNQTQRAVRHQRMLDGEVNPSHGVESTYFNYMCRCEKCRDAHNAAEARRRANRKAKMEAQ